MNRPTGLTQTLRERATLGRIVRLAWREREGDGGSSIRGNQMNLGSPSAAGLANGLRTVFLALRSHRDAHPTRELAGLKNTIYSLIDLRAFLLGCNRRYLEFLSAIEDTSSGQRELTRLTEPQRAGDRTINGLNFFERAERALQRPEFNLHGVRRADLKAFVSDLSDSRLARPLHRLRSLGLIKRVTRTYRCFLTRLGHAAIAAACALTQFKIVPTLAFAK